MAGDDDDDVGYGRPPKEHRWKPGQSGNPKGWRKGVRNFQSDLEDLLNSRVTVTENGRRRKVPVQRAALLRLGEKALKGDGRSIEKLLDLALNLSDQRAGREAERALTGTEEDIIARFLGSVLAPSGKADGSDTGEEAGDEC
jgi:hypothetical protein